MEDRAEIQTLIWQLCSLKPVQFSGSVVSDFLQPHGLQHSRLPCPSPTPRVKTSSLLLKKKVDKTHWRSLKPFATLLLFPHTPNPWPYPCMHLMLLRTIQCLRSTCPDACQWHLLICTHLHPDPTSPQDTHVHTLTPNPHALCSVHHSSALPAETPCSLVSTFPLTFILRQERASSENLIAILHSHKAE